MIEELKVIISAEISKLKQACSDAKQETNKLSKSTSEVAEKIKKAFSAMGEAGKKIGKGVAIGGAAIGTAIAGVTTALVKGTADIASYGDNIDKMSQKLGISAEGYQEWDFIMQHCGTSMDSMKVSMKTLSAAAESNSDAFSALGISQQQIASMNQEELFEATIKGLQNLENGTQRTVLATQLLGKGGVELGALLNSSSEDVEAMKQQLHDMGAVMSNEAVKNAATFQDSLQNLQTSIQGIKQKILADFLPSLTGIMDGLTLIFSGNEEGGLKLINQGVDDFVTTLSNKVPKIIEIGGNILTALLTALTNNLPKLIKCGVSVVLRLVQGIIETLPKLIEAAGVLIKELLHGLISYLPDILQGALTLFTSIVDALIDIIPVLVDAIPQMINAIVPALIKSIPVILQGAITLFTAIVEAIPAILPNLIDTLPEIISAVIDTLIKAMPTVLDASIKLFGTIVSSLGSVVSSIAAKCGEIVATIKDKLVEKAKNIMKFDWSFPKLKLPHFSIKGEFSLAPPKVPHLAIDWYAQGGVFEQPTLFSYGGNNIGGLGEAGAEAIVPLENNTKWLDKIAEKLSSSSQKQIILQVDGTTFAKIACDSINDLARQQGSLPLAFV